MNQHTPESGAGRMHSRNDGCGDLSHNDLKQQALLDEAIASAEIAGASMGTLEEAQTAITPAEMIADLYESRFEYLRPYTSYNQVDFVSAVRYNFFSSVIAQLTGKYHVDNEEVIHILRKRDAERNQ